MFRSLPSLIAIAAVFTLGSVAPVQAQELMAANAIGTTVLFPVTPMTVAPMVASSEAPAPVAAAEQGPKFDRASFAEAPAKGRPSPLLALYASQIALQALDAHSTYSAINRGAHEANPLMQGVVGNKGAMMAVKAGVAAGTIFLSEKMWRRGNRVGAIATMLVVNSVTAMVVAHNYRVASSLR
jgi:hypothetical protein